MEKFRIKGGNKLEGVVTLSGAKNSALKVICASVLTSEKVRLLNIPVQMEDVQVNIAMIKSIGSAVNIKENMVLIDNSKISN